MAFIILDRDGVINKDSPAFIKSPEEWQPIPGSLEAIARLCHAGYRVIVCTNQSGIARGLLDVGMLYRIHEKMIRDLAAHGGSIEAIYFCPDEPNSESYYRKPQPGMLIDLASRLRISLNRVPAVGDRLSDIEAARAAGAIPILVRTGRGQETLDQYRDLSVPVYDDLNAVAVSLLSEQP